MPTTIRTAGTMASHPHKCKKCGEPFTCTTQHIVFREGRVGQFKTREARLSEIPYELASCTKSECAFGGF